MASPKPPEPHAVAGLSGHTFVCQHPEWHYIQLSKTVRDPGTYMAHARCDHAMALPTLEAQASALGSQPRTSWGSRAEWLKMLFSGRICLCDQKPEFKAL